MQDSVAPILQPAGSHQTGLVSVVIPAFNAAKTLQETIDSMLRQTAAPAEIIVVDDGSTDSTPEILAAYGSRIRIIRQPNGGLAAARNAGCAAASGDLIAFIDADDISAPQRLAMQTACMRSDPEIVLCHSDFSTFGEGLPGTSSHFRAYYATVRAVAPRLESLLGLPRDLAQDDTAADREQAVRIYVGNVYERIAFGNFVHPPTMMFRRALFEKTGPFDPAIRNMCDWDWIVRASRFGSFAFIDAPLVAYRISPDQLSGPRHNVQATVDIVEVAERISRRDPELYERNRPKYREALAYYCLFAADALADSSTRRSLQMLAKSVGYGLREPRAFIVLVKALLPMGMVAALRRVRDS